MIHLSIIVAIADNNAIGKNGDLLCHLSADLKRFKALTTGHTIIMGRRTFLSFPKRPLPNRKHIILSHSFTTDLPDCHIAHSVEEALALCNPQEENFIIGGAEIYKQFLPMADKLYLTRIHAAFDADTFFPEIDYSQWQENAREDHEADEKNPYPYSYINYSRK